MAWQTCQSSRAQSQILLLAQTLSHAVQNIFMDRLGIAPVPSVPEHPVDEALFNFAIAWSLMLGPLMLLDPRAQHIKERTRWLLWTGTMVRLAPQMP